MKFLGLVYSSTDTGVVLKSKTRNGGEKSFTKSSQLELYLKKERDLLAALCVSPSDLSAVVEETREGHMRITKRVGRVASLARELCYSSSRTKPARSLVETYEISKGTYLRLKESLALNISVTQ